MRFCPECGIPTVADAEPPALTERQRVVRKIKPQLAEGPLVRIASAANQVEAEFIQSLLLEEGVPSTLRRSAGFDVPDFLAAGPRDVLIAASGVDVARQVLLQSDIAPAGAGGSVQPGSGRLLLGLLAALLVVALLAWVGTELVT